MKFKYSELVLAIVAIISINAEAKRLFPVWELWPISRRHIEQCPKFKEYKEHFGACSYCKHVGTHFTLFPGQCNTCHLNHPYLGGSLCLGIDKPCIVNK
jgi:hypothetical protein